MGDKKDDDAIELKINCRTWLKDTEDLFDFETSNIITNIYTYANLDKDYYIIKYKDESDDKQKEKINFINSNLIKQKIKTNNTTKIVGVLKFNKLKGNIKITNSFKSINSLYMPENCERLYELFPIDKYINIEEGDIIKIGRIRMKFDRISFKSKDKSLYDIINTNLLNNSQTINSKENNETISINKMMASSIVNQSSARNTELNNVNNKPYCRLCYQTESTITDPLISPCNCSGTMKYIHLSCLKNSIKLKYHKKSETYYDMFLFQNYSCEICLTVYPKYIIYKTKVYYLIDIDLEKFENYVLCDLTQYIDNNQRISHFGYLMFKIEDNIELSLGRKKNNHIKLKDISVSRNHCLIMKEDNNLLMKDLGSKFGTMKYIKKDLEINFNENENTKLLTGKHELEFSLVKSWSLLGISNIFKFSCCSCNQPLGDQAELIIYGEDNIDKESDLKMSNEDLKNKTLKKYNYYSKFKDYDSYNDYIIKIDNIIGLDNSDLDIKNNQGNDGNDNEATNNQIKDKEESFTNY
jgi:hypothetical protein